MNVGQTEGSVNPDTKSENGAVDEPEDNQYYNEAGGNLGRSDDLEQSFKSYTKSKDLYEDNMETSHLQIGISPKRWVVLFLFSLITMENAALWITVPSISNIVMAYYNVHAVIVDWFSMSFLLGYAIFAMPASTFMEKFGVKACLITAASLNAIGGFLRYAGVDRDRFIFVAIGQIFAAIGSAFVLQMPPKLAAVWFGEHERATATSIGVLMNLFGVAVGFIQPTSTVEDSNDMDIVFKGMHDLLSSQAWFCLATLFLAYILVDEKPKLPPSRSEALRDQISGVFEHFSVGESMKLLFKSKDFVLTAQAYGLMFGMLTSVTTLLNQTTKSNYAFVSDFKIGMMGFVGTLLGTGATLVVGLFIDRYTRYKEVAIVLSISSVLSVAGFSVVLLYFKNFTALFALFCVFNVMNLPFLSSGLTQIAEITYPVSEELSSTVPLILGNFYGFVAIYLFGWLIDKGFVQLSYTIMTGFLALAMIFIFIAKVPRNRTMAEHC